MYPGKQNSINSLLKCPSSNRSVAHTKEEIAKKIHFMSGNIPQDRAGHIRWQRLHLWFIIVPYQTTKLLYLRREKRRQWSR